MTELGKENWLRSTLGELLGGSMLREDNVVQAGVFDAQGAPVLLTDAACAASMAGLLGQVKAMMGASLGQGDVVVSNDADAGAVNASQMMLLAPVAPAQSRAYVVVQGYVPDFGGWELAGFSPQAVDRWAEGARIEPLLLHRGAAFRREVLDVLRLNSRTPARTVAVVVALAELALRLGGLYESGRKEIDEAAAALRGQEGRALAEAFGRHAAAPARASRPLESVWADGPAGQVDVAMTVEKNGLKVNLQGPPVSSRPFNLGRFAAHDITLAAVSSAMGLPALATGALFEAVSLAPPPQGLLQAALPHAVGLGRHTTGAALFAAVFSALNTDAAQGARAWETFRAALHPFAPDPASGKLAAADAAKIENMESKEAQS